MNDYIEITIEDYRIGLRPILPEVRAGHQALNVTVVWNTTRWMAARVDRFTDSAGAALAMVSGKGSANFLRSQGQVVRQVEFANAVTSDTPVKYAIEITPTDGTMPLTIDPVVLLRKPGA